MRDPGARAGAHDRFQRSDQPAGRALHLDVVAAPLVDVGLAIGNHDHVLTAQFAMENGAQCLRGPGDLAFVARASLGLKFTNKPLQIAGNRLEFG